MRIILIAAAVVSLIGSPAKAQSVPECSGIYLNVQPGAPPYPQGIGLQFNFTLVKDPMEARSSVGCRIPLSQSAAYSAEYVLKMFTASVYWDKNINQFPFSMSVVNTGGTVIIQNVTVPYFTISYVGTSGEISSASDWIFTVQNIKTNKQSLSAGGMIVGDHR